MQKVDKRFQQPSLIAFVSPTITPSHNFKIASESVKEANNSLILGRKIDSPQLRMGKDPSDRQQSNYFSCLAPTSSIFPPCDETKYVQYLMHPVTKKQGGDSMIKTNGQALNQTKKEIYPKQFEFNMKQPKGNVTIQYDSIAQPIRGSSSSKHTQSNNQNKQQFKHQQQQHHSGQNKNPHQSADRERRRGQSQSAPSKHQQLVQSANLSNNGPITSINIQVRNSKGGSSMGGQQVSAHPQAAAAAQQIQNQQLNKSGRKKMEIKFAPAMHQLATKSNTKHKKNRSDSKSQNRTQYKNLLVSSQVPYQEGAPLNINIDNKENMSANLIKKNLFPLEKKQRHNTTHIMNHDHSLSSQESPNKPRKDAFINSSDPPHTSNKIYFLDKSALLKQQLSPSRVESKGKNGALSDDEDDRKGNLIGQYKTNLSTITQKHNKGKKLTISGGNTVQKYQGGGQRQGQGQQIHKGGVDKLVKENLKKNKSKEEEGIIKRYLDDYRQRQKKVELSQRNQEVRKINASKIIYNHQHKNSQVNYQQVAQKYKKQRSKSCMNKTDNIFNNLMKKEKVIEQVAVGNNQQQQDQQEKRERKREKSFVLEMKELKKQIDDEIKREIQAGMIDVMVPQKHKRTNLTTINAKKEVFPMSNMEFNSNNVSAIDFKSKSKGLNISYHQNRVKKHRSKSRDPVKSGNKQNKIQKFIEKKKKAQLQRQSLEQTLEQEKHLKIKENLNNLSRFVKQHFRNQSHIIGNLNNNLLVKKQITPLNPPIKMIKKLKPKFLKNERPEDDENLQEEMKFDQNRQFYDIRDFDGQTPDKSAVFKHHSAVDNDVSQDGYDEYNKLVNSMQKLQGKVIKKQDKSLNISSSREVSPNLNKKYKPQKQLKMKIKMPSTSTAQKRQQEQDMFMKGLDSSPETSHQLTAIKKDDQSRDPGQNVSAFPHVPTNQISSLIPPQSEIASIEGNLDKSNIFIKNKKASLESTTEQQNKSPSSFEFKRKLRMLIQRYGSSHRTTSDTKLLIKLHSAAITIQIQFRKFLNKNGFYQKNENLGSEGGKSSLYINSDDESERQYQPPPQKLKSKNLRMKNEATTYYPRHNDNDYRMNQQYLQEVENAKKDSTKMFYGDDLSDVEKVVVCSVISTERQEGDDSLSNTQKYVPLRTKVQKQPVNPIKTIVKNEQSKHQAQLISESQADQSVNQSKTIIPPLKLTAVINKNSEQPEEGSQSRSIFERKSFREFKDKIIQKKEGDPSLMQYDMFKIREEAIEYHENVEKYYIDKMYKNSQITPRTYNQRKLELEMWVSKEKDDVKKTKKKLQKQLDKTKDIIEQTEKDQERMKKQFLDSGRISSQHTKRDLEVQDNNAVVLSSRLLDQIYETNAKDEAFEKEQELQRVQQEAAMLKKKEEEEKKAALEQKRLHQEEQERLRKQKEEESRKKKEQELKEQERKAALQEEERVKKLQKEEQLRVQRELEKERKAREEKEKLEQEMKRREELEEKRKAKERDQEKQKNLEELYKQKMVALENKFKQQASDKYDPRGKQTPEDNKFKSEPEFQLADQENDFIREIVREGKNGKVVDEDSSPDEGKEPGRALTRTRNSMDLQLDQINDGDQNLEIKSEQQDFEDLEVGSPDKDITNKVLVDNFFTKNYDEQQNEKDLMESLKNKTSDLKTILKGIGINEETETRSNIYIKNEQEEERKSPLKEKDSSEPTFTFNPKANTQTNQANLEFDERQMIGAPVSPASADGGQVFGIQTGSQSLESTLSDEMKFKQAVAVTIDPVKFGEEIAEDIYNSLLDELKIEMDLLQARDSQQKDDQPPRNYMLSESGRFLIFERKGIKTDLFAIESYVEEILDEVLRDKDKFMTIINEPITKKELDILNQLQNSEIGSYEHFFDVSYPTVLPLDVYLKLEKRRKESREKEVSRGGSPSTEQSTAHRMDKNFLAECEHIHNKVLFDCINDSLLQFKPYGKDGTPLAWSRQVRRLKPVDQFPIEDMFEIVKHDVRNPIPSSQLIDLQIFRMAITQAGTLPRKEFVFGGVFDDELFAEIREKKLAQLLAREMIDTEPKWLNYEFEEAQVKIDIGDMILEFLVTETLGLLNEKVV